MKRVCLDTNAFREITENNQKLISKLEDSDEVFVSPIVVGELLSGFMGGSQEKTNRRVLEKLVTDYSVKIIPITKETTEFYANIRYDLRKKGKPIPTNDIWIASQAMENGAVLVTYDQHFSEIPGLRIWGE